MSTFSWMGFSLRPNPIHFFSRWIGHRVLDIGIQTCKAHVWEWRLVVVRIGGSTNKYGSPQLWYRGPGMITKRQKKEGDTEGGLTLTLTMEKNVVILAS